MVSVYPIMRMMGLKQELLLTAAIALGIHIHAVAQMTDVRIEGPSRGCFGKEPSPLGKVQFMYST